MKHEPIPEQTERVASQVLDAAMAVHKALGPGLLESVYEVCLCHELSKRSVPFERQLPLPVVYDGLRLDAGLRLDVLVANCVIVELKSVEKLIPLYDAQLLTYLKLTGLRVGLMMNFNSPILKNGLKRLVN